MKHMMIGLTIGAQLSACSGQNGSDTTSGWEPLVPKLNGFRQIVPAGPMPPQATPQAANNNLDITWHDGRLYLAFRTAPTHFASALTELLIVSSEDEEMWRYEGRFHLETDIREPQLVSWKGQLHLFFAVLGTDPAAFEPGGSRHALYNGPDDWTEPEEIFEDDFIPWRIKEIGGQLSLVGYTGGGSVYDPANSEPIRVRWLTSDDGVTWSPTVVGKEVVYQGGASETDLVVRADGSVIGVIRNEAGDEGGFGSKICRAEPGAPADWQCVDDKRKYDSPLVFEREDRVWLIARRNLTATGHYDLGLDELDHVDAYYAYQLDYWTHPKRCALWEVDPKALVVHHVMDLPSKGDTCFPEAVELDGDLLVYNYSSDPDSIGDPSWLEGQTSPTGIYRQVLDFNP
jgi:hypothetical protein